MAEVTNVAAFVVSVTSAMPGAVVNLSGGGIVD
jgi:hypothetical protein